MKKIFYIKILIFVSLILAFNRCKIFNVAIESVESNFATPAKVKNKIKEPVKEGVKLSALWIGHATVLIQMDNRVILTDPFLTNHIAELQQRIIEPGLDINNLKKCDIILISHSHPDHLNLGSLKILEEKFPHAILVFPEGVEEFIPDVSFRFQKMKKPDQNNKIYIGESKIIDSVKITTVAAFHWGGRYGLDGFLWGYDGYCGFIIEYKGMTVYFSGDTSYDENFSKYLGEHYNIDLELIPIGPCTDCYKVDSKDRHVYPKGALKILDDTKAKLMIPVHYGTVKELAGPYVPKIVLEELIDEKPVYKDRVKILKIGEQIIIE